MRDSRVRDDISKGKLCKLVVNSDYSHKIIFTSRVSLCVFSPYATRCKCHVVHLHDTCILESLKGSATWSKQKYDVYIHGFNFFLLCKKLKNHRK